MVESISNYQPIPNPAISNENMSVFYTHMKLKDANIVGITIATIIITECNHDYTLKGEPELTTATYIISYVYSPILCFTLNTLLFTLKGS